jgi:hypothetical protein
MAHDPNETGEPRRPGPQARRRGQAALPFVDEDDVLEVEPDELLPDELLPELLELLELLAPDDEAASFVPLAATSFVVPDSEAGESLLPEPDRLSVR